MFERILLPLDGSELAETAIPYVWGLAGRLEAEVYLLHACPPEHEAYLRMHKIYLNNMAEKLRQRIKEYWQPSWEPKIQVEVILDEAASVVSMDAAYEILEMEKKIQPDLVVMATRGRSNIARWALGSVAEKVLREGDRPILMVKETAN
jgi:nucleotide-binding universal stress UspA family protein